jgi:hypothetical protein
MASFDVLKIYPNAIFFYTYDEIGELTPVFAQKEAADASI